MDRGRKIKSLYFLGSGGHIVGSKPPPPFLSIDMCKIYEKNTFVCKCVHCSVFIKDNVCVSP